MIVYSPRAMPRYRSTALLAAILWSGACAPEIGDPCESSIDCDVQNKRMCDLTQPGGYCTLRGCESGTCPDEAVCVMFRPEPVRLAETWCMAGCEDDDDCRDSYDCVHAEDLGQYKVTTTGEDGKSIASNVARSLDGKWSRFCSVPVEIGKVGDSCKSETDCDRREGREQNCDETQPGGYCTIKDCVPGECPEGSLCMKYLPRSESRCVDSCDEEDGCREGYRCRRADEVEEYQLAEDQEGETEEESAKFCVVSTDD
jgi:hypothetical protein